MDFVVWAMSRVGLSRCFCGNNHLTACMKEWEWVLLHVNRNNCNYTSLIYGPIASGRREPASLARGEAN